MILMIMMMIPVLVMWILITGIFSTVVNYIEGDIGAYPIPQYRKNNWQVPKYHVLNQRNTNTAFMIDHVCLKVVSI